MRPGPPWVVPLWPTPQQPSPPVPSASSNAAVGGGEAQGKPRLSQPPWRRASHGARCGGLVATPAATSRARAAGPPPCATAAAGRAGLSERAPSVTEGGAGPLPQLPLHGTSCRHLQSLPTLFQLPRTESLRTGLQVATCRRDHRQGDWACRWALRPPAPWQPGNTAGCWRRDTITAALAEHPPGRTREDAFPAGSGV